MLYKIVTSLTRAQKQLLFLFMDAAAIGLAFFAALLLNAAVNHDLPSLVSYAPLLGALVVAGSAASWCVGLPLFTLNAYDIRGVTRTAAFAAICGVLGAALNGYLAPALPMAIYVNFALLLLVACATCASPCARS